MAYYNQKPVKKTYDNINKDTPEIFKQLFVPIKYDKGGSNSRCPIRLSYPEIGYAFDFELNAETKNHI